MERAVAWVFKSIHYRSSSPKNEKSSPISNPYNLYVTLDYKTSHKGQ